MSESNSHLLRSGAFLVVGTIIVLITIILLGGDKKIFSTQAILHAEFSQVQGLNMGAVVSLSGLPIGNVSNLTYNPETGLIDVEMKIRKNAFQDLVEGTLADIRTQGALGDKYIYIIPGTIGNPPLQSGKKIEAVKSTDFLAMLSEKGAETERIFEIINQIHALTKSLNEDNKVGRILSNLDEGSTSLKRVAKKSEQSMEKFDRVMTRIDKAEGTLGALISDPAIHDQIKTLLGGSQRKSHVKSLLKRSVSADVKN